MYTILLKDSYAIYRRGITEIIKSKFPYSNITEVDSIGNLADMAGRQNWDIIIFDVTDSSNKNFQLLLTLQQTCPQSKLIITTHTENLLLTNAFIAAGALACVNKNCSAEDFIKAIDKAVENKRVFV